MILFDVSVGASIFRSNLQCCSGKILGKSEEKRRPCSANSKTNSETLRSSNEECSSSPSIAVR